MNNKYLIYTRVSPKGSAWTGGETTVHDQAAQCRAFVAATDPAGTIVDTITDEFESGGSSKRPGWQKILTEVRTGTAEWDVLVVRHLDRFSRSISDAVNALELIHKNGKHLIATAQGLNSSNASGRGVINILLSIAQMEREFSAERVRLKMYSIAAAGLWPAGHTPYGYQRAGKRDNRLVPDPEKAPNVKMIFSRYKSGTGPLQLARDYHLATNSILYILKNKIYLGIIPYDGHEYKGQHKALITPKLYAECQHVIPKDKHAPRPRAQKYPYLFTGLVFCECGRTMTPASAHGRNQKYYYYRCTDREHCKKRTNAPELEEQTLNAMRAIKLSRTEINDIIKAIRTAAARRTKTLPKETALQKQLTAATEKKDRLTKMFVDGLITADNAELINRELTKASEAAAAFTGQIDALRAASCSSPELVEEMITFARNLTDLGALIDKTDGKPDALRTIIGVWVKEIRQTAEGWNLTLNLPVRLSTIIGDPNGVQTNRILLMRQKRMAVYAVARAA